MTKAIILIICLSITVLTGGGWAEELLHPECFGDRCHELSSLREPSDGDWNCWDVSLGAYVYGDITEQCNFDSFITTSTEFMIKFEPERFDKILFNEVEYCKNICFKLKGDDVERCVETEWLYKWLKMMQP